MASILLTEATVKGTKNLKNLDQFVSVNPLELDDATDCLQDYNSLPPEESVLHILLHKNKF